jgi:hypothetical protein
MNGEGSFGPALKIGLRLRRALETRVSNCTIVKSTPLRYLASYAGVEQGIACPTLGSPLSQLVPLQLEFRQRNMKSLVYESRLATGIDARLTASCRMDDSPKPDLVLAFEKGLRDLRQKLFDDEITDSEFGERAKALLQTFGAVFSAGEKQQALRFLAAFTAQHAKVADELRQPLSGGEPNRPN